MKGKHFLKSYYQSLRTVSVSWCQTVLRTVTCHTRVTKCSPSLFGREPKPCGMQRDCGKLWPVPWHGTAVPLQAGHFCLWSQEEGGWEGAHDRSMRGAGECRHWCVPVCKWTRKRSPRAVRRNEEVAVLIWGRRKGLGKVGKHTQQQESWWDGGYEGANQEWEETGKKGKL